MRVSKLFAGSFALIIITGVFVFTNAAFSEVGVTDDTIKIGATGGITGPAAFICVANLEGAKVLFDHVNDTGGIHGRKIKFIIEDDGYQPAKTVAGGKKLISRDKIFALCNTQGSGTTLSLRKMITKYKVPLVAPHMPPMDFFDRRIFWTPLTSYSVQFEILVDYVVNNLKKPNATFGLIYQDDVMGVEAKKGIARASKHFGVKVLAQELYKRGNVDFSSQVYKLRKANPDVVLIQSVTRGCAAILTEINKIGWKPIILGSAATADSKVIELAGKAAEGYYVIHSAAPKESTAPGIQAMLKMAKKYSPKTNISSYFVIGHASGMILVEALKRAGRDLTREGLIAALESFNNVDMQGVVPPVSYSKTNHLATTSAIIFKANLKKKRFDQVTGFLSAPGL